jgi:Haem-degrading
MQSVANAFKAITAAILICVSSPAAWALDKAPVLTMDLAKQLAAGCEAKAKEMKWKMNISVVDGGANQIFFEKMDGAYLGSGDIALHKARTSARFPFPTRGIEQLAYGKDLNGGHRTWTGVSSRNHCIPWWIADHDGRQRADRCDRR